MELTEPGLKVYNSFETIIIVDGASNVGNGTAKVQEVNEITRNCHSNDSDQPTLLEVN